MTHADVVSPLNKNQLTSGEWSVVVLSNNGASGEPIAYQRDFYLSVGVIPTHTVTPTVTGTAVVTPIYSELLAIHSV